MAVTQICIDHDIILGKNKCIYAEQEIEFLGLEIKVRQIIRQKFPEKIEDRKQLERFLGCLTYTSDFVKDLAKLGKPLQQKLKKEVNWIWTTNDTRLFKTSKRCVKIFPPLICLTKEMI